MSKNEENELDCLIIEYKDKIEVAEQNNEPSSALRVALQYLKDLKEAYSFALELLSEKELEIHNKWCDANPKERKAIEESWEV